MKPSCIKVWLMALFFLVSISSVAQSEQDDEFSNYIKFGAHSTKYAILFQLALSRNYSTKGMEPEIDGLILQLGVTDSDVARNALVDLIDIYVGESRFNALMVSITMQGDKILPLLKNKRGRQPVTTCVEPELTGERTVKWCTQESVVISILDRAIKHIENNGQLEYIW